MVLAVIFALCCIVTCNGSPILIVSTPKDIRVANVSRPSKVITLVKDLEGGAAVDFYYEGNLVCWTDHYTGIHCITYNGTHTGNKVNVMTVGVATPDGLACDWVTKKLYWTDSDTGRIEVTTLDGKYRNVLFWEDIDQPRAIALVPQDSIMFWTDWGEVAKIERAAMNGDPTSRKVLVTERLFWPNGLTVDFDNRKVYWLDGKLNFVEVMDYDGRNRRTITDKGVQYPVAIALFKDKLYWTSWETRSIHMYDRNTGGESRELIHIFDQVPIDIKVMEPSRQPYKQTPCRVNNGGCSHLCLLSPNPPGYSCSCPTGVKLIDNYTCADGPQKLLLLVQMMEISLISLDTPDHTIINLPLKGIKHAIAIDYDPIHGHMYWTDDEADIIRRARLDGTGQEDVISSELKQPDGLAIDWRAQNIYWTDAGTDRIQVAKINTSYTKVLINSDLIEPRAIAVSPDEGLMFWSDWYEKRPKIERAALDGSQRAVIVNDHLGWPNGIALDMNANKIYWCDAKTDRIEMINYDGTDRREVITDNIVHVFGLSLLGDHLYWTDWQRRGIDSAHKITGADRKMVLDQQANLMGLKAVGPLTKPFKYNPCAENNGNCTHLCLNTPSKYVCACQMGYELAANGRSCVIPEAFLLFARKENIGRISIENAHNDAIIPVSGIKDASALDFDISDNRIYWTDVKAKAITRAYINGSHVERIVEFGLETPEGLAVDWVAHNIYWTDTGTRRIEVARLDGRYRRVIIWSGLQEPRSIAVDPSQRFIYWSEWAGVGSIHRARLDGTGPKLLINKLGKANSLTIDSAESRIYWCALKGSLESANLDGTRLISVIPSPSPFTMSLYQDKVYWSDWQTGALYSANKRTGFDKTVLHTKLEKVTSVVVYHSWGQSNWDACVSESCSYLCLMHCTCPTHYTLQGSKCIPPASFMLVSTKNTISRLMVNTSECPDAPLPIHGLKNVKAIEYDPVQQALYWIDNRTQSIRTSRWYQNGSGPPTVVVNGEHHPFSLALDPYARVLFWSCITEGTINATKLDNGSTPMVVIRSHESEKPRYIAIHPLEGLLFWVSKGRETRIYRCRLDGVRRTSLVNNLPPVTALAVDQTENIVYWATPSSIEAIDINGNNRRDITLNVQKVGALAVMGQSLYWLHAQSVVSFDRSTGKMRNFYSSHTHFTALISVNTPHKKENEIKWECLSGEKVESYMDCSREGPCNSEQFACHGSPGDCIPKQWRCDAATDCPDASDEANCPQCPPDKFTCQPGQCIDKIYVCDGTAHCSDNSDENDCCVGHQCGSTCLPSAVVCDGWNHCADGSDETPAACAAHKQKAEHQPSANAHVLIAGFIVFICLVLTAVTVYRCRMTLKPGGGGLNQLGDPALDPLSPVMRPMKGGHSVRMSNLGEAGGRSTSSQPSSLLCYPLNPPPSPATTSKECCRPLYRPPPPTPCSTDVCHETDSNYQGDSEPFPPPPTPTSLSPSPSSSTYFHPAPPPSPTP